MNRQTAEPIRPELLCKITRYERTPLAGSVRESPIKWDLRVSAVSYLNTWPLVWGFLKGPGQGTFDFRFDLPAVCADALANGDADIGLVPCAELDRLGFGYLPDLGIASTGPVRSILLISRRPFHDIRTLAVDSGSRTSVALARILLAERYGVSPVMTRQAPELAEMLSDADAALIIGDPALRLDPHSLPYHCLDLGEEWTKWCGLPMVFAVWAGRREVLTPGVAQAFQESYEWGSERIREIASEAHRQRGFEEELATDYLTRHIEYRLTARHREGLELFRERARAFEIEQSMV